MGDHLRTISILIISGLICLSMIFHFESVYKSPEIMDGYFGGQLSPGVWDWPGSWSWQAEPFRFRVLFHGLVDVLAFLLQTIFPRNITTYWVSFVALMICSAMFATVSLDLFLEAFGIQERERNLLLVAWFLMPPIHSAFVPPV